MIDENMSNTVVIVMGVSGCGKTTIGNQKELMCFLK